MASLWPTETTIVKQCDEEGFSQLLQLRLFGLHQDGDVGIGVFPEREEIFVSGEKERRTDPVQSGPM
jgi:hypothetical protein